jgi:hypothetical protein
VKVHHITALGVDLIVLPVPCGNRCNGGSGDCPSVPAVGGVVDGDIECPRCKGTGLSAVRMKLDALGHFVQADCRRCGASGTVSVPHEVVAVVPLVANFEGATMPNAVLLVTETGVEWWGRGDNEAHHLADLVLPDAEPGGVAVIVERAT